LRQSERKDVSKTGGRIQEKQEKGHKKRRRNDIRITGKRI
jgi:hypothetical protein